MNALEAAMATVLSRHGVYSQPLLRELYNDIEEVLGKHHVLVITKRNGWSLEHSLECRLSGKMSECDIHTEVADGYRPTKAGRYRFYYDPEGALDFEPMEATT